MENTSWHKQQVNEPLFPNLLWSRPQNKRQAGKLLIAGGNAHGFSQVASAYQAAIGSGAGAVKVLLPDALYKIAGGLIEDAEFAPSTKSGSFASNALAQFQDLSHWADGIFLAGEFGRNAETTILLEKYTNRSSKPTVLTKDTLDNFYSGSEHLFSNQNICLAAALPQLQKLCMAAGSHQPITLGMDLIKLVEALHTLSAKYSCHIITEHHAQFIVASSGQVSTTKIKNSTQNWQIETSSSAAVWWLQNPGKPFEALTAAVYEPGQ